MFIYLWSNTELKGSRFKYSKKYKYIVQFSSRSNKCKEDYIDPLS